MAEYGDGLWPFEEARRMMRRNRGWGYALASFGSFVAAVGFLGVLAALFLGAGEAALGSMAFMLLFGLLLAAIGYSILRRTNIPRGLLPIGGGNGRRYFIGDDGIYRDGKLLVSWVDVDDVRVITERTRRYRVRPVIGLGLTREFDVDEVREGVIRVYLRDGRSIDVPYVIYPTQVVEYVRSKYLRSGGNAVGGHGR